MLTVSWDMILSNAIGGVIAALIGWFFAWLGSRDLDKKIKKLQGLINTLSRMIEDPGTKAIRGPDQMMTENVAKFRDVGGVQPAPSGALKSEKGLPAQPGDAVAPRAWWRFW